MAAESLVEDQLTRTQYSAQGEPVVGDHREALHAMLYVPLVMGPNPLGLFEAGDLLRPLNSNCGQPIVLFHGLDGHRSQDGDSMGTEFECPRINQDICE